MNPNLKPRMKDIDVDGDSSLQTLLYIRDIKYFRKFKTSNYSAEIGFQRGNAYDKVGKISSDLHSVTSPATLAPVEKERTKGSGFFWNHFYSGTARRFPDGHHGYSEPYPGGVAEAAARGDVEEQSTVPAEVSRASNDGQRNDNKSGESDTRSLSTPRKF
ncbi:hypothetical protein EDB85DRAFT_1932318 [Lactarius pseudohatsudake]|nr:hypothetical protein EDB85DRAFT_1932318 [Lactarius pseudohatsudake]